MTRALYARQGGVWTPRGSWSGPGAAPETPLVGFAQFGPEAGGYLTGLSVADDGTMYTRADVGGAYRKAPGVGSPWTQMFTLSSVPTPRFDDFFCDAISCSASQPQHVYAAVGFAYSDGRVMRSTDGGTTWTLPGSKRFLIDGNGENRYAREPLAVQHDNPDVCLYGTRREGLWRTTNGGNTWSQLTALPDSPVSAAYHRNGVTVVLIERGSARVGGIAQGMWAAVRGMGIYRTTNGGTSWTLLHSTPAGHYVRDAMLDSTGALLAVTYPDAGASGSSTAVKVTTAGVVTVITPSGGSQLGTILVHPTDPQTVWIGDAGIRDTKFWRSTNGGTSWTTLNVSINNGTDGAIWPTQSDLEGYMSTGQVRYDPSDPTRLWFAEGMGAWWSNDLADTDVTWTFASKGVQELVANAIVKPPGTGAVAATWDRGVWKWNDSGKARLPYTGVFCSAWDVQARPDAPLTMAAVVSDHQTGDTNPAKRLSAITTDGGLTWTRLAGLTAGTTDGGLRFGTIAIARGSTDRLVWAPSLEDFGPDITGVPLRYSTDRGATWQTPTVTPEWPAGARISDYKFTKQRKLVADPNVNDKFYALGYSADTTTAYLLISTDGGANWARTTIHTGTDAARFSAHLTAVKVGTSTRLFWTTGPRGDGLPATLATGQLPVRTSTDGGATWTTVPGLTGGHCLGVGAPISPSANPTLFSYGWVSGVRGLYYSTNLGINWTLMVNEPGGWHQGVSALAGDSEVPGKVYVGMPGGSYFVGQV